MEWLTPFIGGVTLVLFIRCIGLMKDVVYLKASLSDIMDIVKSNQSNIESSIEFQEKVIKILKGECDKED